ncbi:MAG: RHS repeat-associated core domain-containing protein [Candidatus Acidiferrum sp.]
MTEYGANGTTTANMVSEIDVPDGSKYLFSYEPTPSHSGYVTGRLASVTYPAGGSVTYTYTDGNLTGSAVGSNDPIVCANGGAAGITRAVSDGTTSNTWTYARTLGSGNSSATLISAPEMPYDSAANQTIVQFQGIYETQRDTYQGSAPSFTSLPISESTLQTSGLLQEIQTCYNGSAPPCTSTAVGLPFTERSLNTILAGSQNLQSEHLDYWNTYGQSTETFDYDFGSGAIGSLLKGTYYSYASLGHNLNAFVQTVKVVNASGTVLYRQDKTYDSYGSGMTCVTGAPEHDNTGHGCSYTSRGNVTSVTNYTAPATQGGAVTKNFTYDSLGNMRTAQVNCCELKTANFSTTTGYAYPDSVVKGSSSPQLTTSFTYDLNMGLTLTSTDPNNVKTTYAYDSLGRTLSVTPGSNPATNYTYTDSGTWSMQVCSPVQGTNTTCQNAILDGLGRTVTAQLLSGSGTLYSATDTKYDPVGRAYKTSNPYTGSSAYWTQTNLDALGRPVKTTLPDSSVTTLSYTNNTVLTTDPTGKQREQVLNELGQLTSVYEPDPTNNNSLTLQTSYTYTILGKLTTVSQSSQPRTFGYDSLGRASSTTTPEGGTVCFGTVSGGSCQPNTGYDNWGDLLYRTDARGVQANYIYDSLNRLLGVAYTNVPTGVSPMPNVCKTTGSGSNNANVCYTYGTSASNYSNGRITSMTDASGSESYSYDQFGNITQVVKVVGTTTYTAGYTYNLANQLTQLAYPSGRVVAQNLDTIGRLSSVVGTLNSNNTTYASGFLYNAAQQPTGFEYGNNLYASYGFSAARLQLTCLDYSTTNRNGTCTNDSTTRFGLQYGYPASPSNNGQISGITDAVDNGRSATYTYDSLYRLTVAATTGSTNYPAWGLQWSYDKYGNRPSQSVYSGCSGNSCPTSSVTISTSTNQITGSPYAYDASGNMTNDGQNTLTYDGVNRTTLATNSSSGGGYVYDGKGLRVEKCVPNCTSPTTTTVYIFSNQKVIAEYDNGAGPTSPSREYIYAGGKMISKITSTATTYYHQDHLSNRVVTDTNGNTLEQLGHYPFGESWYNSSNDKLLFTSYERDAESGNDYALARYYISRLGRFNSPDPVSGNPTNPQTWNRYSYVVNDPINLTDPEGEYCQWDDGSTDDEPEGGGASQDECEDQGGTWIDDGGGGGDDPCASSTADSCVSVTADAGDNEELQQAMDNCVDALYGVEMTSFTPAEPGKNGSFSGIGPNIYFGSGDQNIYININVTESNYEQVGIQCNGVANSVYPVSGYPGCIRSQDFDYGNFQALAASTPGIPGETPRTTLAYTSITELGNALAIISGQDTWQEAGDRDNQMLNAGANSPLWYITNNPPGVDLLQCVINGGLTSGN